MGKRAPAITLSIVIIFALSLSLTKIFRVLEISCTTSLAEACSDEVTHQLQHFLGKPLFFYDLQAFSQAEVEADQPFEIVSLQKELPSRLLVVVAPEEVFLSITNETGRYLYTKHGKPVLTQLDSEQLPITQVALTYSDASHPLDPIQPLNPELLSTITTINSLLQEYQIAHRTITWHSPQDIRIMLENSSVAIVDATTPATALNNLRHILAAPEVQELPSPVVEIDLRFAMPVLRTSE